MAPTVKGATASGPNIAAANVLLGVAKGLNAGLIASTAMIYAAIWESGLIEGGSANSLGYGGVLAGSSRSFSTSDSAGQAKAFLQGDSVKGYQAGGAISLARTTSNPVEIAVRVEVPSIWPNNAYASETGYPGDAAATAEAQQWVTSYGGGAIKGGVAGAGGTGTVVNGSPSSTYQFKVGGTDNPDEDVWTAVNRLAQEVNWYLFSNGEMLYYLDAEEMIAQKPALTLDRVRDAERIQHLDFTWDNTAFGYVAHHKRKFTVQRQTRAMPVTSPTAGRLDLICGIDEIRGGDVIMLSSCGPGNGRWIVGDRTRSVFSTVSSLQLVPPIAPLTEIEVVGTTGKKQSTALSSVPGPGGTVKLRGGATNPAPGAVWGRLDMGFDGNYGPAGAVAPFNGTIHGIGITGWPGEGQYFAVLNDDQSGPDYTRAMYFAEGATPLFGNGSHVRAGQKIGNPVAHGGTGAPGNFEIGPANASSFDTLAKNYGLGSAGARQMVLAFYGWLRSLGAGATTDSSSAGAP